MAGPNTDNVAVRNGIAFGVGSAVLGCIIALLAVISQVTGDFGRTLSLGGCIGFIAVLGLLFEAGNLTAQRTGTVSSGALAGTIAGALGGAGLGLEAPVHAIQGRQFEQSPHQIALVIGFGVAVFFIACLFAGIGSGLGALGSLIGIKLYKKPDPGPVLRHYDRANDRAASPHN